MAYRVVVFERLPEILPTATTDAPSDIGTPPGGPRQALGTFAGTSFDGGLYRLHTAASAATVDELVFAAYPDFEGRIACFGMDWLGRQFSLDPARGTSSDPEVLLYDIGAGEALEVPVTFSRFHDEELVNFADAALAAGFFAHWRNANPDPLDFNHCAGYTVPLFLGGADDLTNLELADLDVYWTLTGQLRVAALG